MHNEFETEKKQIGMGKQAAVYLYDSFAYKVYKPPYPVTWIEYEIENQQKLCKTNLPVVNYFKTEDPYVIKMDYIDGISLGERIKSQGYKQGVEDLIRLQKEIHLIQNIDLPKITERFFSQLEKIDYENKYKTLGLKLLKEIEDKDSLCHLDFHFNNVMFSNDRYFIIDWVNIGVCNPIFDFARTYVILYEYVNRMSQKYLSLLKKDKSIETKDLYKAIYIMALLRTAEGAGPRVYDLIEKTYDMVLQNE